MRGATEEASLDPRDTLVIRYRSLVAGRPTAQRGTSRREINTVQVRRCPPLRSRTEPPPRHRARRKLGRLGGAEDFVIVQEGEADPHRGGVAVEDDVADAGCGLRDAVDIEASVTAVPAPRPRQPARSAEAPVTLRAPAASTHTDFGCCGVSGGGVHAVRGEVRRLLPGSVLGATG